MKLFFHAFLLSIVLHACSNSKELKKLPVDIWRIDTTVNNTDSILTDSYGRSVIKKYDDKNKKIYVGEYQEGKLNGLIEIYNTSSYLQVIGRMKDNRPEGVWLFLDTKRNVDSAIVIVNKEVEKVDKMLFHFDTIKIFAGDTFFSIKKPQKWGVVSDSSDNNIGVIEPIIGGVETRALLILNVDTFSTNNNIDLNFGVKHFLKEIQKNYKEIKILNEGYFFNGLGTYYQLEISGFLKDKKFLIIASIFIDMNRVYTVLGVSEYKNDADYFVCGQVMKDISSSLQK